MSAVDALLVACSQLANDDAVAHRRAVVIEGMKLVRRAEEEAFFMAVKEKRRSCMRFAR